MASDPEQLADAPPNQGQSQKLPAHAALLFGNHSNYSSPYAPNSTSLRPARPAFQNAAPTAHYRQPDFHGPVRPPPQVVPYPSVFQGILAPQSSHQYRSPYLSAPTPAPAPAPAPAPVRSQSVPSTQGYQSPYLAPLPEPPRLPPNFNATFTSQYNALPGNGYQNQQVLQQGRSTTLLRDTPCAEMSLEKSGAQRLATSSISPKAAKSHYNGKEDPLLDGMIESAFKNQHLARMLNMEVTTDEDQENDDQEEDDEDRDAYEYEEPEESDDESDFLEDSDTSSRQGDDGEISDADSVMLEHEENLRKLRNEVQRVRDIHKDHRHHKTPGAKARRGGPRGPRKIAELTGDIKMRLDRANNFYFQQKYSEARQEAQDIIQINAEVWQAWQLLESIWTEWSEWHEARIAKQSCIHFMPKEERGWSWLILARRIDAADYKSKQIHLQDGVYCCSAALQLLRRNVEALCLKAGFNRDLGNIRTAIGEYQNALRVKPYNSRAMHGLALCYLDMEKPELAKKVYEEAIAFYQESGLPQSGFGWDELAIYIELFVSNGEYTEAITRLKIFSRWILGREEESYWDDITEDDREWDTHDLRRHEVSSYQIDRFDALAYGDGLPLDLRAKLGICRLKLGNLQEARIHFSFIESEARSSDDEGVAAIADLLHVIGDKLYEAGYYEQALTFYEILKAQIPDDEEFSHYLNMGRCYFQLGNTKEAEDSLTLFLYCDPDSVPARQELIKIYDSTDNNEESARCRQKIRDLVRDQKHQLSEPEPEKLAKAFITRREHKRGRKKNLITDPNAEHARQVEEARIADLLQSFETVKRCNDGLKAGDAEETLEWMTAAADLVADFRTCKGLYPYDKYYYAHSFVSRSQIDKETAMRNENRNISDDDDDDQEEIVARDPIVERRRPPMPTGHLGIAWATWLDILLQYALCLSREQRFIDAYDVCISAKEAVVYCHDQEAMFTIYLCWCTCAVLNNDLDTIVSQMRHFMKVYQFTNDAYRLFGALVRLCQSPLSHLTKGPTTKYILRNIKLMDFSLLKNTRDEKAFEGRTSYSARDARGNIIINTEMDINLLLLYGHILYVNTSFGKALHYLFRAYSLDPVNPMINMSVGLCYIQYALKRQTQYRPYVIMQGISFIQTYYENRKVSERLEEREEAHYNMARTYHMLGLNHLAVPFYLRVLKEAEGSGEGMEKGREDLVVEAAYNLQTLYSVAGNVELARGVTERWLVI